MKRFSFMIAFFVWILSFSLLHTEISNEKNKGLMSQSEIQATNDRKEASVVKGILFATTTSLVTYFGICGFMIYLKDERNKHLNNKI